jgi:LuxR family maltose regulon positive regulatory protein
MLARAAALAARSDTTQLDDILVAACKARVAILRGDLGSAARWAEERDLWRHLDASGDHELLGPFREMDELELTTLAWLCVARGRADEAIALLERLLAEGERGGAHSKRNLEMRVLRTMAWLARGDSERALRHLERTLALAAPEGYVQVFINMGRPMAKLLYQAVQRGMSPEYAGRLLAAYPEPQSPPVAHPSDEPALSEPLSQRELDVLGRIARGMSNRQIALELHISLRTVKWHASNIYGKLAVRNRTQAVARARSLGLLQDA